MNFKKISKKVKAVVLLAAVLTTSIPSGFLTSGIVKAEGEDVTDSSEITYNYDQFMMKYTLKDNTTTGDFSYDAATHTYTWPTGVGVNQIKEISGRVAFSIPGKENGTTEVKKGNHLTFTLPEVLSLNEGNDFSLMARLSDVDTQIGTYSISGNTIIVNLDSELIGKEGIDITSCFVAYSASINTDKIGTETMNRHSLAIKTGEECAIAIPCVPTELKTIKESGEVLSDNSVKWTIELGDANDTGVVLAGGTVLDILDGQQTFTKAYLGTDEANTIAFTQDTTDTNKYSYTFPADSTLTAPLTITVITHPTDAVMAANPTGGEDISLSNNAKYIPAEKDESEALSVSEAAIAKIHKATVTKTAEVVDGNTLRWKIALNDNKANVWRAVVKDVLSKGLTVDEEYGIHVLDKDTNEEIVLTSGKKSDTVSGVVVSYDVATAEGKQTLYVNYNSTFSHEYLITFHTKVDGNEYKGTASIDNIAYVESSYPTGGGTGGASIAYGSPNCHMDFLNAFVKIEATSDNATALKTGVLSWKATPSTKMSTSVYAGGVLKLSLGEGHGFVNDDLSTLKVYDKNGTELDTSKYTKSLSEGTIVINFSDTSLDINGVYATFDTKAFTYFADDEKHDYIAYADFSLKDKEGNDYPAKQAKAKQTLKNNMAKKTVSSKYDTANKEALFTFEIAVNANELSLTDVDVTDDLSSVLYALDASKVGSDGKITSTEEATPLDKSFYEVRNVFSANGGTVSNTFAADGKVKVHYDKLNKKDIVSIEVGLTEPGKAKLKYGEALSEKVIFVNNKATVTAKELDSEGISSTVTGTGKNEIAVNKVVVKSGEQLKAGGQNTSTLQWGVDINSMGADLGSAPVITDTIPDGLTLDKKSVKLYLASYGEHGTIISGKGSEVPAGEYSFNSVKKKNGTTALTVNLPTNVAYKNASYGLVYETAISGTANAYSNSLEFSIDSKKAAANSSVKIKAISYGVGTVRAFLTMTKTDELSPSTGVKGAKYGIFESEPLAKDGKENDTIDVGYTNDKGQITFTVPGTISGTRTYYLRELEAPTNSDKNGGLYKKDDTVYTIGGVTYGRKNIGKTGVGDSNNFVDEREKDIAKTGEVNVTNIFKEDKDGNKTSSFELYIKGEGKNQRVYVEKLSDGNYKFLGFVDDASKSAKISVVPSTKKGENSEGGMKISGLPWGEYELVQKTTADGFVLANKTSFAIKTDDAGNIVNPGGLTVENKKTVFTIKDQTEGVTYQITESGEGGRTWELTSVDLKGEGKTYTGEMVQGKTYTINETIIPDGYQKHGEVKVENFDGEETEEITETPIKLNVVVKDQDKKEVSDAGVVVKEKDKTESIATSTNGKVKLEGNISVSKDYVVTGTLTNQYMPIDSASVKVHVDEKGTGFTPESTKKDVMSGSVDKNTLTITVQKIKANVEILEYSETDTQKKTPLTGGTFELHKVTGEGASKTDTVVTKWSSVTDKSDSTKPDISALEVGTYYILQKTAPSGYETIATNLKSDEFTIDASMNGKTIEVPFVVHPVPGKITLTKISNGNAIKNNPAEYQLYVLSGTEYVPYKDASNKEVKATTNNDGVMVFENLPWGSYEVKETKAPKGYKLNSEMHGPYVIDVTNQNIARDVSDDPTTVKIKTEGINITNGAEDETGATKDAIKANYTIKGGFADGSTELHVEDNGANDSDSAVGSITVSNKFVLGNSYTFEQTAVDKPYLANEHPFNEAQTISTGDETVTVKNYMTRFGVKLISEYDQILSGKFVIEDEKGDPVKTEFATPALENSGVVEVCGLAPGTYTLVETEAPVVTTQPDGIKKYYALDDSGIKFRLYADNTVEVLSVNTVTDMVRAFDPNRLNNGTKVKNTLGKSGSFKKSEEAILTYANTPTVLQFNVAVRYNETCNEDKDAIAYLPGISYGIYKTSDCKDTDLLAKTTTVKKENDEISNSMVGVLAVEGLPNSKDDNDFYYVRMIENKESNIKYDSTVYKIQVDNYLTPLLLNMDGSLAIQIQLDVHRQDLTFTKKDAEDNSKLLEGSTYKLYRKDSENAKTIANTKEPSATDPQYSILKNVAAIPGLSYIFAASSVSAADSWTTEVAEATTGADGKITFKGVDVGVEYMIQEVKAPAGYQVSKDPIKVKFVRDSSTGNVTLTNTDHGNNTATIDSTGAITWKEPRLKVGIELTDESGKALPGGTLELYDAATGTKIETWNTDGTQKVFSGTLTGGKTYIVRQTGTPNGYITAADYTFVAESKALSSTENYIQKVTLVDKRVVKSSKKKTDKEDENGTTDANAAGTLTDPANLGKTKKKSPKTGEWF